MLMLRRHHALKSCSATIGAYRLADRSKELELTARAGFMTNSAIQVGAIVEHIGSSKPP